MNLDEAQLLDRIGRLRREDLSEVASQALQDGVDSHSLALLAGLAPAEADRSWELWKGAIKELGRTEPSFIKTARSRGTRRPGQTPCTPGPRRLECVCMEFRPRV